MLRNQISRKSFHGEPIRSQPTDRQTTKLIVAFHNLVQAPENTPVLRGKGRKAPTGVDPTERELHVPNRNVFYTQFMAKRNCDGYLILHFHCSNSARLTRALLLQCYIQTHLCPLTAVAHTDSPVHSHCSGTYRLTCALLLQCYIQTHLCPLTAVAHTDSPVSSHCSGTYRLTCALSLQWHIQTHLCTLTAVAHTDSPVHSHCSGTYRLTCALSLQ